MDRNVEYHGTWNPELKEKSLRFNSYIYNQETFVEDKIKSANFSDEMDKKFFAKKEKLSVRMNLDTGEKEDIQ